MKDSGAGVKAADKSAGRPVQVGQSANAGPTVQLDCSNVHGSYANVCNVSSTREEVVLAFGINNAWERGQANVQVQMTDRIVLNPYTAKRLANILNHVVAEYEATFGPLKNDPSPQAKAA
ncbi:MAG TPA: DUF3467 domain-containing protein [Nitrospira sp.]|nr:DUF3467 domain-containing protein [Nitrospira sp.]